MMLVADQFKFFYLSFDIWKMILWWFILSIVVDLSFIVLVHSF